jgi:hypothetical protein
MDEDGKLETTELGFFTCQQLIEELMRRKTFLGVVIRCDDDFKGQPWHNEKTFRVHFNSNLNAVEVSRLLDRVSTFIDHNLC